MSKQEMLVRVRKGGDGGIVHRGRGRRSNRRLPESLRTKTLKRVQAKYSDVGPTLACEYLAKDHQVEVSKETLRQWLIGAGLRRVKRRKAEEVHVWRPRRSCRGELAQWDTSEHDWLEGRGPRLYLVAMIDDATSQAYARFVGHDSTEENLRVLWGYVERWGRPVEFYTDKSSLFTVNTPQPEAADEAVEEELTQNRLVKGLRLAKAASLEEANTYLEGEYLPLWNRSFTVVAANPTDAHRRLSGEHDLPAILSHVEERVVTPDYTIRYQGKIYQIGRSDIRAGLRGGRVRVEQRLDGSLAVKFREHYVSTAECQPRPKTPPPPKPLSRPKPRPKVAHNWMKGFDLRKSPRLGTILAAERAPVRRDTG